jgi:hypothetical protein
MKRSEASFSTSCSFEDLKEQEASFFYKSKNSLKDKRVLWHFLTSAVLKTRTTRIVYKFERLLVPRVSSRTYKLRARSARSSRSSSVPEASLRKTPGLPLELINYSRVNPGVAHQVCCANPKKLGQSFMRYLL